MTILATYRCSSCNLLDDHWVPSPPPALVVCAACGAVAQRRYSIGFIGRASASKAGPSQPMPSGVSGPACRANPDVPLLCHIDPVAALAWIARFRGDHRPVEQHASAAETAPPAAIPRATHRHHHHHHHHDNHPH